MPGATSSGAAERALAKIETAAGQHLDPTAVDIRLAAQDRDVIVLHYLQGLSYQELAQVLGQPTGTVKWRTREALENLRRALEDKITP